MVPTVGRPAIPARYTLNGVLYHHGTPASGGRYTVDVLHPNTHESNGEAWVRVDDDSVSTVGHEEVFGRHDNERTDDRCAYLLFYRRTASTDLTT
jgi:ubiquitin carboxyl-terminal hydrolase 10